MTAMHQRYQFGNLEKALASRKSPPINTTWEREKGRGLMFDFGEYRLKIATAEGSQDEVVIYEDCSMISTRVWDCSVLTAKCLENIAMKDRKMPDLRFPLNLPSNVDRPLQVLELGAGTGLLSVCLAKLGAAVLSTEYGSSVKFLKKNCVDNEVEVPTGDDEKWTPAPGRVTSCELDWFNSNQTLESMFAEGQDTIFDLIVVTDCSLTNKDSNGVMEMIHKFGTTGHTRAIVGVCKEREGTPYCAENIPKQFKNVKRVPEEDYHPEYSSSRYIIWSFEI
ncbi:unnamed protein product [Cylindrotheca closterium]|uniref:Uncharacterized protein n=1 Tax=Cylindrotheca closterium TaxID=2856 RepID=A0AAD2JPE3_9STRA|nr:unnamed protein product [Cylindrotheca closterium]